MTLFIVGCVLLVLLAAAFIAVPMLRSRPGEAGDMLDPRRRAELNARLWREQRAELERERSEGTLSEEQHAIAVAELDRRALAELPADASPAEGRRRGRWLLPASLVLLPVAAVATYLAIGSPMAMAPPQAQFERMIEQLAARLQREPGDAEGWAMLARSYLVTGRASQSVQAYARAVALKPNDADLLAGQADALATQQGRLEGEPMALVEKALAIDPKNTTALALSATASQEARRWPEALARWQRLAAAVADDPRASAAVAEAMGRVRAAAAAEGVKLPDAPAGTRAAPAATRASSLSGEVSLAPALAARVQPQDVVFVFARASEGPPLPLAVARFRASELPIRFTLDDSMAMAPGMNLSAHRSVTVGARISRSGQATPQPGDLSGQVEGVSVGSRDVQVRITEIAR
jgi:cytochrome c-type biogenesis protein CcmH